VISADDTAASGAETAGRETASGISAAERPPSTEVVCRMGASGIGRLVRIIASRIARMSDSAAFERMRANLNAALAFAGFALDSSGELMPEEAVCTLSEAERRAKELRADLSFARRAPGRVGILSSGCEELVEHRAARPNGGRSVQPSRRKR